MFSSVSFFFNDTATTEIYTPSLHDALPIYPDVRCPFDVQLVAVGEVSPLERVLLSVERQARSLDRRAGRGVDRKSTRLNSSHANISDAVLCLQTKPPPITVTAAPAFTLDVS